MKTLDGLTDLQMVVLSWLTFHPGHSPEDIAKGLRAEDDLWTRSPPAVRTSQRPGASST